MKDYLKQKLSAETIFAICIFAYLVYVFLACLTYGAYTRYIPMIVSVVALVLTAFVVYKAWNADPADRKEGLFDFIEIILWTFLAPVLIYLLGFLIGGPIFCFIFTKIRGKDTWLASIISAVVIFAFLFVLDKYLGIYLYRGLLLHDLYLF